MNIDSRGIEDGLRLWETDALGTAAHGVVAACPQQTEVVGIVHGLVAHHLDALRHILREVHVGAAHAAQLTVHIHHLHVDIPDAVGILIEDGYGCLVAHALHREADGFYLLHIAVSDVLIPCLAVVPHGVHGFQLRAFISGNDVYGSQYGVVGHDYLHIADGIALVDAHDGHGLAPLVTVVLRQHHLADEVMGGNLQIFQIQGVLIVAALPDGCSTTVFLNGDEGHLVHIVVVIGYDGFLPGSVALSHLGYDLAAVGGISVLVHQLVGGKTCRRGEGLRLLLITHNAVFAGMVGLQSCGT